MIRTFTDVAPSQLAIGHMQHVQLRTPSFTTNVMQIDYSTMIYLIDLI